MTNMRQQQSRPAMDTLDAPLYDRDFYRWTQQQITHLQQAQWADLDVASLNFAVLPHFSRDNQTFTREKHPLNSLMQGFRRQIVSHPRKS